MSRFFPAGPTEIEFLGVVMSDRGMQFANKFAAGTDNAWLLKYIATVAKPGEPLPYHPNLGLTEEEYAEPLTAAKQMA